MFRMRTLLVVSLLAFVFTGILGHSSTLAQQGAPFDSRRAQCRSVFSQETISPVLARHRDRLQTARENMLREERTLGALLVAENTTRGAIDAQMAKSIDARSAFARARLDLLWDLRTVIPAQNRELAFRCADILLRRR